MVPLAILKPITTILVLLVAGFFFWAWVKLRFVGALVVESVTLMYFLTPVSLFFSILYGDIF